MFYEATRISTMFDPDGVEYKAFYSIRPYESNGKSCEEISQDLDQLASTKPLTDVTFPAHMDSIKYVLVGVYPNDEEHSLIEAIRNNSVQATVWWTNERGINVDPRPVHFNTGMTNFDLILNDAGILVANKEGRLMKPAGTAWILGQTTRKNGNGFCTHVYVDPPVNLKDHFDEDTRAKFGSIPEQTEYLRVSWAMVDGNVEIAAFPAREDGSIFSSLDVYMEVGEPSIHTAMWNWGYSLRNKPNENDDQDDWLEKQYADHNYLSWETIDTVREEAYEVLSDGEPAGTLEDTVTVMSDLYSRMLHIQYMLEEHEPDAYKIVEPLFRPHVN